VKALALAALLAAPCGASRPLTPPAPEFPDGAAWLNSQPFTLKQLRGRKVVVVAFFNPTGLDSIRSLRVLKAWFDRYALSQVMVIGVVTPSLELEREVIWLKSELKRLGVEFPVVVDRDRAIWNAYENQGWPAIYLVDRRGRILYDQLGEGGSLEFEAELRTALADLIGSSAVPPPVDAEEPKTSGCGRASPDVILGARAKTKPIELDPRARPDEIISDTRLGEVATAGAWRTAPDGLRLAAANPSHDAMIRVVFQASQALAVLAPPPGGRSRFFVKRDDEWLHEGDAGRDVRFDDDGRSYVDVAAPRLYDLVRDDAGQPHELFVLPEQRGSGVYGFTFADSCLVTDLP
jgi:hypothetical protein